MGEGVREQLIDIAVRLSATRGLAGMTLRDVQVESGQRNKSVVQYYFGSRHGLIEAVMDARMGPINSRRLAILEQLGHHPSTKQLIEALVLPLADVATHEPGSYWARFLLQGSFDPTVRDLVRASFTASSFRAVRAKLIASLETVPTEVRGHRVDRMVEFMLVALASAEEARTAGRLGDKAAFRYVADLVDMCSAMLTAPATWLAESADDASGSDGPAAGGTSRVEDQGIRLPSPACSEHPITSEETHGNHQGHGRAALERGGRPRLR